MRRLSSVSARSAWSKVLVAGGVAACASTRTPDAESRYIAVHNTLASMGLAQVGPAQRGTLASGQEVRLRMDLAQQCTTLVAMGGEGVSDLEAVLVDSSGATVARDTTRDPQAVLRACVDSPGAYTLVIKMAAGAGSFVVGTWSGSLGSTASGTTGSAANPLAQGAGTCESPIPLAAGTTTGTNARGEDDNEGSCGRSDSKEVVYRLDVPSRQRVSIDVQPRFDAVIYIRKDDCTETSGEIGCNDDAPSQDHSKLDVVLDPGTYFVFVDGYGHETGSFRMTTTMADVPSLADVCRAARPLAVGMPMTGTVRGFFDHAHGSCGEGAKGWDVPYRFDVARKSRVRITERSDDLKPVVHLRKTCADEQSEVGCADTGLGTQTATYTGVVEAGSYTVFADTREDDNDGRFQIIAETAPEQGATTAGDSCPDAIPLGTPTKATHVTGDTFTARDDFAGKCGGAGAPDVVYRLEVPKRARLMVKFDDEESDHLFVLQKQCGDRATEIACGGNINENVAPGTYYLAVDGSNPTAFGKFVFNWNTREVGAQEGVCRAAPTLAPNQVVQGTTAAAGDHFSSSCAGREDAQASSDKVYKFALAARTRVRLVLTTRTWDGVLVLRKNCLDAGSIRASELVCNNDYEDARHSRIENILDPGTYYVIVDGHASGNEGPFTLEYKIIP